MPMSSAYFMRAAPLAPFRGISEPVDGWPAPVAPATLPGYRLMHGRLSFLVCAWLALVAGCSVESDEGGGSGRPPSAGGGGAAGEPVDPSTDGARATLTIIGDSVVRLGFGESVELVVKLENSEGEPQRDQ